MRRPSFVRSLALLSCVACGGPPLEFADWTMPVPEDVVVHEYAAVPMEERRGNRIEAVEDLVLGSGGDPQQAFYRPRAVVPDAAGNIYVLDQGNSRVQVFDAGGGYLHTLGRAGQGPGEMPQPLALAVAGDRVVVRAGRNRINMWALDGSHIGDVLLEVDLTSLAGLDDGFIGRREELLGEMVLEAPPTRRFVFARYGPDGEEAATLVAVDRPPPPEIGWIGARSEFFAGVVLGGGGMLPAFTLRHAASRDGTLYVTTSEEYQVHAFGSRRWALRAAWPREPITEQAVEAEMVRVPDELANASRSELGFPEHFKAIAGLQVDGHGHLYVFPFHPPMDAPRPRGADRPREEPRPVDVYAPDGEHLFSGVMDLGAWSGALGDFVYNVRRDPDREEDEIVRYRLVEPF